MEGTSSPAQVVRALSSLAWGFSSTPSLGTRARVLLDVLDSELVAVGEQLPFPFQEGARLGTSLGATSNACPTCIISVIRSRRGDGSNPWAES